MFRMAGATRQGEVEEQRKGTRHADTSFEPKQRVIERSTTAENGQRMATRRKLDHAESSSKDEDDDCESQVLLISSRHQRASPDSLKTDDVSSSRVETRQRPGSSGIDEVPPALKSTPARERYDYGGANDSDSDSDIDQIDASQYYRQITRKKEVEHSIDARTIAEKSQVHHHQTAKGNGSRVNRTISKESCPLFRTDEDESSVPEGSMNEVYSAQQDAQDPEDFRFTLSSISQGY